LGFLHGLLLRLHTMPYIGFFGLWWVSLPLWCQNRKLGELGLGGKVLIRTVLGTMAVLLGFVAGVVSLRNFTGVDIGTGYILNDTFG